MIDHLQKRFGDHLETINRLRQDNEMFAEMCAHYEELCTWLTARTSEQELTTEERSQARELIEELQSEISETRRSNQNKRRRRIRSQPNISQKEKNKPARH